MQRDESGESVKLKRRRFGKKRIIYGLLTLIFIFGAAAFTWYKLVYSGPIPYKYRRQIRTALYYPQNLPDNLHVDRSSFDTPARDVLTYIVRDDNGNKYYVSQQPTVSSFDYTGFKKKFENTQSIETVNGSALLGDLSNELICSLNTPKNTWIIINTPAFLQTKVIVIICRALLAIN